MADAAKADRLHRMRKFVQHVVDHPNSKEARIFMKRLRAKRATMRKDKNVNLNPKVTLAVKSCESLDMAPVDPTLFIEEMLDDNIAPTNVKVVEMFDNPDTNEIESAICVPRAVAKRLAPAANTRRVSVVEALVTRLAEHPDQDIQLSQAEAEFVRTGVAPKGKDGQPGSITRMQHLVAMLKANLVERMRKDPASAKNLIDAAKKYGFDLGAIPSSSSSTPSSSVSPTSASSPLRTRLRSADDIQRDAIRASDALMKKVAAALGVKNTNAEPDSITINMLKGADTQNDPNAFNSAVGLDKSQSELNKLLADNTPVTLSGGANNSFMTVEEATVMLMQLVTKQGELKFDMVKTLFGTRGLHDVWKVNGMAGSHSVSNTAEGDELNTLMNDRIAFFTACAAMWNNTTQTNTLRFDLGACVASLEPFRSALGTFWQHVEALQSHGTESFPSLRSTYGSFARQIAKDLQAVWTRVLDPVGPDGGWPSHLMHSFSARIVAKFTGKPPRTGLVKANDLVGEVVEFVKTKGGEAQGALQACKDALNAFQGEDRKRLMWTRTFAKRIGLLVMTSILGFEVNVVKMVHTALRPWVAIFFQEIMSMIETAGREESSEVKSEETADTPPFDAAKVQDAVARLGALTKPPVQLIHRFIQQRAIQVIQVNRALDLFRVKVLEVVKNVQMKVEGDSPFRLIDLMGAFMGRSATLRQRIAAHVAPKLLEQATQKLAAQFNAINRQDDQKGTPDMKMLLNGFKLQLRAVPAPSNTKERKNALLVQRQFDAFNAALMALACAAACELSSQENLVKPVPAAGATKVALAFDVPKVGFPSYEEKDEDLLMPEHVGRTVYVMEMETTSTKVSNTAWDVAEKTSLSAQLPLQTVAKILLWLRSAFVYINSSKKDWMTGKGKEVSWTFARKNEEEEEGQAEMLKKVDACLKTITALLRSTFPRGTLDMVTEIMRAVKLHLEDPSFTKTSFGPDVSAKRNVATWWEHVSTLWYVGDGSTSDARLGETLFQRNPSLDHWAPIMKFLPYGNKVQKRNAQDKLFGFAQLWLQAQNVGSGDDNQAKAISKAYVWSYNFKPHHPIRMAGEVANAKIAATFGGGMKGAEKRNKRIMQGDQDALKEKQRLEAMDTTTFMLADAVLFDMAGLSPGETYWSFTDTSFQVKQATIDAIPLQDVEGAMNVHIDWCKDGLLLAIASSISQLTLQQAMEKAQSVKNTKVRSVLQSDLSTLQNTALLPQGKLFNRNILDTFAAFDADDAASIVAQWCLLDDAQEAAVPATIKAKLQTIRAEAVRIWNGEVVSDKVPPVVRAAIGRARSKIESIWTTSASHLRNTFVAKQAMYSFGLRLAHNKAKAAGMVVEHFLTPDAVGKLGQAGARKGLYQGLEQDLLAESKGDYVKSAMIEESWSKQALKFNNAFLDTFAKNEDGTYGGLWDVEVPIGRRSVVTTRIELGSSTSTPAIKLGVLACALLSQPQFLHHMKESMPLTLAFCALLASLNNVVGNVVRNNQTLDSTEQDEVRQKMHRPLQDFKPTFLAALVNSLGRHTSAGWLDVKPMSDVGDMTGHETVFGTFVTKPPHDLRVKFIWQFMNSFDGTSTTNGWLHMMNSASKVLAELFNNTKGQGTFVDLLQPLRWDQEVNAGTLERCTKHVPLLVLLFFKSRCQGLGHEEYKKKYRAFKDALRGSVNPQTCELTEECAQWWKDKKLGGSTLANFARSLSLW